MGRIARGLRDAWLVAGITLLLFCLLEGSLSLALRIRDRWGRSEPPGLDSRARADTYSGAPWTADYYREFHQSHVMEWHPYVYWRRKPYQGRYINVDSRGIRRTVPPASTEGADQRPNRKLRKILLFGGSTLWGTGARDEYTIPSILARELAQLGVGAEVVNLGESGYVSTQEVLSLILQLERGEQPDLVILYDGVNDVSSAYEQRVAGLPQNELHRSAEFNLSNESRIGQRLALDVRDLADRLATVRAARWLLRRSGVRRVQAIADRPAWAGRVERDRDALAREILDAYQANIGLVEALSRRYGFEALFYWQPTIFQKATLSKYEHNQRKQVSDLGPFYRRADSLVRESGLAEKTGGSFHNLGLVFAEVSDPLFVDWCHLGETGNELIAKRMALDVAPRLAISD
jgi:lysophospholipase L1-like esterase